MRASARGALGLAALLAVLSLAGLAGAEPPQSAAWGSITVEGAPVDAGFLDDGSLVLGTTAVEAPPGTADADCSLDTATPELFLVSFPEGPGCVQAIDTSDTTEGVAALGTSSRSEAVLVALPIDGSQTLAEDNLVRYELEDGELTEVWREQVDGTVLDVALDPEDRRGLVTYETSDGHRLAVVSPDGDTPMDVSLPGEPRDLRVSENGRFVAVGGEFTDNDARLGWAHLYDLAGEDETEPVVERTIPRPRAGIVASLALEEDGSLYAGLLDGTVRWIRPEGDDREVSLGNAPARVDVDTEAGLLFAASGNDTARLQAAEEGLDVRWRSGVNGTVDVVQARAPHLFAMAETLDAFGPGGDRLWETTAGSLFETNQTGLGAVVANEASQGGTDSARSTVLEGRVLHRNLTLAQPETIEVTPGGVNRANATLHNVGAAILQVEPTARDAGVRVHTDPTPVVILPGERRDVSFTVQADRGASPGQRSIPLSLDARPSVDVQLSLDVRVTSQPNVTISLAGGEIADRDVTQGQRVDVRLDVRNLGNAETQVDLAILQSVEEDWPVTIVPQPSVSIPAESVTTARAEIEVPPSVANGTTNRLIVTGESPEQVSAVQVNLTVNPFQVIRIRPDTITQEMAPGETRPYDLTAENLGSIEADVSLRLQPLDADGQPCLPTAWGLSLDASQVDVPAQGSHPVRVEITSPRELPVPEVENGTAGCTDDAQRPSLRVEVQAVSDEGSADHSILFANVDPNLAEQPDDPNEQPFAPLVLVLAILGALARVQGAKA